ncbi:MAG: hypothetical protein ACYDD6_03160 [Acidimicrobiales bacterium]
MDLGHGFLPRIDARNYKAVERSLPRDGPGLFNVGLDLPWAILEGPWALAPPGPLAAGDRSALSDFVETDLKTQASLGASEYLLRRIIPRDPRDDVRGETLALLEIAETKLPGEPRPCIAFIGAHTSSMEAAHQLIDDLPHWVDGIYLQLTPVNPLHDSPSKIVDGYHLAVAQFLRDAASEAA